MCQNFRRKWTRPLVTSNLPWRKTYSTALRDTSISSVLEPTADLKVGTKVWKLIEKRKRQTLERNKFIFRSEQLWKNFCVLALWEILHSGNGGEWDQGVGGNDIFQFEYDAASLKDHLGNKTKYFRLRQYDEVWLLSECSLSALRTNLCEVTWSHPVAILKSAWC